MTIWSKSLRQNDYQIWLGRAVVDWNLPNQSFSASGRELACSFFVGHSPTALALTNDTMPSLETKLQELFLFEYFELPREEMLVGFIKFYCEIYQQNLDSYRALSSQFDQAYLQAMGNYCPTAPSVLTQACEELASLRGVYPIEVINSLLPKPKPVVGLQSKHDDLLKKHTDLEKRHTDLKNSIEIGKWLN